MASNEKQISALPLILHNDYQRYFTRNGKTINAIEINDYCATIAPSHAEDDNLIKKNYPYLGRQVPGQAVDFEPTTEPWSQYKLSDGSEVKVKMVLLNAARLDEFNEQGEPIYQFQFQQIIGIVAPDSLKRKAQ